MYYPAGPKGNYFKVYRKLRDNGYKPGKLKESEKKEAFELLRKETNLSVEEIEIAMDDSGRIHGAVFCRKLHRRKQLLYK